MGRKSKSHSDPSISMTKKKAKAVKEDEKVGSTDIISELPPYIVTDILSRLPFNSVLSCRCVCKTWLHLLMDPSFAQLYHTRAHPCIILQPTYKYRNQHLYAVHFDNKKHVRKSSTKVKFATKTHLCMGCDVKLSLLDSCNGLILLGDQHHYHDFVRLDQLYVCNPITGEFVIIKHKPGINLTSYNACLCLGFCPKTQVYKVVLLSKQYGVGVSNSVLTLVYTLGVKGNGLWKSVNVGNDLDYQPRITTFLNGIIHWVVISTYVPQFIYSFDVEDECFRFVPPPPEFVSPEQTTWSKWNICLGVLEGCLAISEHAKDVYFHIWVMKDYGVQASWTKAYTMDITMEKIARLLPITQILGLCHNGDILFTFQNRNLVSFNPANSSFKLHRIESLYYFNNVLPYIPNFSSLRDIARGEPLFNATLR
ncbi:F-box protein At3g07870-like [Castanea sativa]|uniref:F-box protein At3g07870-like n=1 Tax=Castanea sativa TaxID=21020 RepID=UPI003F64A6E5